MPTSAATTGAAFVAAFSIAGFASAHTAPIILDSTGREIFTPGDGTGDGISSEGEQGGGTMTYTAPDGSGVTATFQAWVGSTIKPFNSKNWLFSGTALSP